MRKSFKLLLGLLLAVLMVASVMTVGVFAEDTDVAMIGGESYASLAEALAAAKAGDTIIFMADITEDVTVDKAVTLDGAGKSYTGAMTLKADATIKSIYFDGKGYNGYAITTRGAQYLTIEGCTAKNYGYGFVQLASATALTTVKNCNVFDTNYGVKVDYSNAVVLEDVSINVGVAALLNSNYGEKTITIRNSYVNILGTWDRENPMKTTYVFEGENIVDQFIVNESLDTFKLKGVGSTLQAPGGYDVTTDEEGCEVAFEEFYWNGVYSVVEELPAVAQIGETPFATLADAIAAAQDGDEIVILQAGTYKVPSGKNITITGAVDGVVFDNIGAHNMGGASVTFNNVTFKYAANSKYKGLQHSGKLVYTNCTFYGQVFLYGESETFNNCTFINTGDNYNVWTYGAKAVEFNGCTFNCDGKSVLIYAESASITNDVTFTGCEFTASAPVDGKAAIEMDSSLTSGIKLTIDAATTATGFANGNVSGNSLWNNKKGNNTDANNDITVVVDGETVLAPVTFVAYNGKTGYTSIDAAIKAAKAGDTVTILAGEYSQNLNVNKAITVVGATDADGNLLTKFNGKLSITANGATVKNLSFKNSGTACYVGAKDVLIEGCVLVGSNGLYQSYTSGTVTFKDSTITGGTYGIHFDGNAGGEIVIDNCVITGWTSFAKAIKKVTMTGTTFEKGNYNYVRLYQEDVIIDGCTFNENMKVDIAVSGATATVTASTLVNGSIEDLFYDEDMVNSTITVDGKTLVRVAKIGNAYYETLEEALAAVTDYTLIKLVADATLDYNAREAYGRQTTTDIIIDGQGFTLTLNQKDSDWASIGMANSEGKLTLKNMTIEKTGYGDTSGAWNTHAIIFSCNVEMINVTVNNGIAVQNGATLNNVTINEANGYYGLWINGNGQTVTVTGGAINATNGGRGIKIADQYINDPASVTLKVTGMTFNTAKKAAVLVSSKAGAAITATDVDITKVVADSVNFAWVDEDWAANFGKVTVNGNPAAQEGISSFVAAVVRDDRIAGYYKTLTDAIAAAQAGDTVRVFEGTYKMPSMKAGITIEGVGNVLFQGTLSGTLENLTLKNLHIKGGNAQRWAYAKGDLVFENVTFEATSLYALHFDGIAAGTNLMYRDCTIIGWAAMGGSPASCVFDGCTIKGNGTYGVIRTYFDATIVNSIFDVSNVNTNDAYQDGIHAVDATVIVNGCTNVNGDMNEIIDTSGNGYVVIDGTSYHFHDWKKGETVAPDYGKDGYTVYNCPCGESEHRDVVPALFTAAIGSTKYATLADAVAAAKPGATITLLGNASGAGVVINKNLTIDFRNFTYTFNEGVGSTGTESNGIQILKGTTVILRNGTLKVADEAADKFYILIQNYSDKLTLNHLVLDGRNLDKWSLTDGDSYVLSNNSGKVTVNSQTKFIVNDDGDKAFAFDVCDKSAWGYALPTITLNAAKAIYVDETTLATNYKQYIEATAVISNTYYATLQQAVNMGGTVNLFRDIEGPGVVINKDVNINFGNFTYTLTVPVGSTGTASNGFQILKGNTVTLRNGTLKVADEAAGKFYILIQNYADLYLSNITLDGTNLDKWSLTDGDSYTLSNNSGNVNISAGTTIIANNDGALAFAFDACDKTAWGYELPVVTVHKNAVIEGNIEAAAKIGNKYYATLQQAIDAAADKQTVTLLNDITVGKNDANILDGSYYTFFKVEGKSVTIDLNGHNIFADTAGMDKLLVGVFSTENDGHLTLNDTAGGAVVEAVANGATVYSLIANYESGCSVTINGGTYKLDKASDSLIYSGASVGENEGIVVNGGTFLLGNVDTGTNGKPWIFNVLGANDRHVDVHGGTFNFNIAYQNWAHEVNIVDDKGNLSYVIDNGDGTWTVSGKTAEVGIVSNTYSTKGFLVGYATFKDAVASIKKGQAETTIKLQKNITVKGQFIGHSYAQKVVIDLNGYTMSSADKTLTVYRSGTTVLIKNGTVSGNTSGGTIQVTYGGQLTLENVTVKSAGGSGNAIKVDANSTLIIADENVKVLGGARVNDILAANGAIIKISAGFFAHPVKDEWCAEGYFPITVDGGYSVATGACMIGDTVYGSLADAIEAAKDGDIIVMKNDITVSYADALDAADGFKSLFVVSGKTITIDLNGKKILGDATGAPELVNGKYPEGMLLGMFTTLANGHLTLVDSSEGEGTVELASNGYLVYGLIVNYDKDCSITINEGNYIADDVFDALVYTSCDEGVVVNDGYFYLANVGQGTRGNGSPWIFNALGQNINSVVVNGGTFNANINAQHWVFEVKVDKTLALKDNGDGTWTVVKAAAYVNDQHWASGWYTRETGYATFQEALAAWEGVKTMTIGKKDYTSEEEIVTLLGDIDLDGPIIIG